MLKKSQILLKYKYDILYYLALVAGYKNDFFSFCNDYKSGRTLIADIKSAGILRYFYFLLHKVEFYYDVNQESEYSYSDGILDIKRFNEQLKLPRLIDLPNIVRWLNKINDYEITYDRVCLYIYVACLAFSIGYGIPTICIEEGKIVIEEEHLWLR